MIIQDLAVMVLPLARMLGAVPPTSYNLTNVCILRIFALADEQKAEQNKFRTLSEVLGAGQIICCSALDSAAPS